MKKGTLLNITSSNPVFYGITLIAESKKLLSIKVTLSL